MPQPVTFWCTEWQIRSMLSNGPNGQTIESCRSCRSWWMVCSSDTLLNAASYTCYPVGTCWRHWKISSAIRLTLNLWNCTPQAPASWTCQAHVKFVKTYDLQKSSFTSKRLLRGRTFQQLWGLEHVAECWIVWCLKLCDLKCGSCELFSFYTWHVGFRGTTF